MKQQDECNYIFPLPDLFYHEMTRQGQNFGFSFAQNTLVHTDQVKIQDNAYQNYQDVQDPEEQSPSLFNLKQQAQNDRFNILMLNNVLCCEQKKSSKKRTNEKGEKIKNNPYNDTKNIPKNFGKAILSFIRTHKKLTMKVIHKYREGSHKDFLQYMNQSRKQLTTIADLRQLWMGNQFSTVLRCLSCVFLRKYSLNYIFNSRICNYQSHIKYRQRFIQAIKNPQQFEHIKQY